MRCEADTRAGEEVYRGQVGGPEWGTEAAGDGQPCAAPVPEGRNRLGRTHSTALRVLPGRILPPNGQDRKSPWEHSPGFPKPGR